MAIKWVGGSVASGPLSAKSRPPPKKMTTHDLCKYEDNFSALQSAGFRRDGYAYSLFDSLLKLSDFLFLSMFAKVKYDPVRNAASAAN